MPPRDHHRGEGSHEHQCRVKPAGASVTQPDRQGPLAHLSIARQITEIVHHEQSAGERTDPAASDHAHRRDLPHRDEGRTHGGDETEEHKHEHLPETEIAVGGGPSRVTPPSGDADHADGDQPPRDHRRESKAGSARDPKGQQGRSADMTGWNPASDEPQRTDPIVVGAPNSVAVVVRVVHRDLQGEAHHERERDRDERHALTIGQRPRGRRPDRHRHDRGRQRARPSPERPESPTARQISLWWGRRCGAGHGRP